MTPLIGRACPALAVYDFVWRRVSQSCAGTERFRPDDGNDWRFVRPGEGGWLSGIEGRTIGYRAPWSSSLVLASVGGCYMSAHIALMHLVPFRSVPFRGIHGRPNEANYRLSCRDLHEMGCGVMMAPFVTRKHIWKLGSVKPHDVLVFRAANWF